MGLPRKTRDWLNCGAPMSKDDYLTQMSLASPIHSRYTPTMSRARKDIIYDNCLAHVTFKCHNSEYYFRSEAVKASIVKIVAKNKKRYKIPIYDYVFMSNHPHFLIYIEDVERFLTLCAK